LLTRSSGQIRAVSAAGALCAAAYLLLAWATNTLPRIPLALFFGVFGLVTGATLWTFWKLNQEPDSAAAVRWVLVWAVLFRLIGFYGQPIYEDDFYRYLWDGRTLALGGNPYLHPPSNAFGDDSLPPKFQNILDRINFPDVPTIYGPVCQAVFAAAYWMDPGELWPLKLIFLCVDLATLVLLYRLLGRKNHLVIYAWSPLLIKEISFSAHSDILAVCLLVAAIERFGARKLAFAPALLALAVASKVIALLFAPFLLLGNGGKHRIRGCLIFSLALFLLYAPFRIHGGVETQGLGVFLQRWEFNSSAFAILQWGLGDEAGRVASLGLFAAAFIWLLRAHLRTKPGTIPPGDVLLGLFFLFSPVANPWYFTAPIPFVTLGPSAWGLTLLSTVFLSYITGLNLGSKTLGPFNHPAWVRPLEILPVIVAAVWGYRNKLLGTPSRT
jgi:alpha-1,6-mannosyltransferase